MFTSGAGTRKMGYANPANARDLTKNTAYDLNAAIELSNSQFKKLATNLIFSLKINIA